MLADEENYSSVAKIFPWKEKKEVGELSPQRNFETVPFLWVRTYLLVLEQVDMPYLSDSESRDALFSRGSANMYTLFTIHTKIVSFIKYNCTALIYNCKV